MSASRARVHYVNQNKARVHYDYSVSLLADHVPLMELRHVLATYGCRRIDLSGVWTPHRLLQYIVRQDRPEALHDMLCVVAAYENLQPHQAYFSRLLFLISNNRVRCLSPVCHLCISTVCNYQKILLIHLQL